MSILVKNNNAYSNIVGVSHKRSGAYEAVQGVYVKTAGVYGRVDAAPWTPNRLTGTTFSTTQILSGLSGSYNPDGDATRVFLSAPNTTNATGGSLWCAVVKATGAVLRLPNTFANYTNAISVSVDGGAYSAISGAAGYFTLFSGLSDVEHFVVVQIGASFGTSSAHFVKAATDALVLSGSSTYVDLPSGFSFSTNSDARFYSMAMGVANTASFFPALSKRTSLGSNISTNVIKGNFQYLYVSLSGEGTSDKSVYVSVDGAAPTKHSFPVSATSGVFRVAASAGVHTYYVWADASGSVQAVSGDSTQIATISNARGIHQFGDSLTEGNVTFFTRGEVDILRVAASLDYAGLTAGISGNTIANLDTNITTYLSRLTVTSADVAVIHIGRNNLVDNSDSLDAGEIASYQSIISKVLAKGYGKVLCRGVLPSGDGTVTWTAGNASIQSIVTGLADSRVRFVDVSGCPTFATNSSDNTHPSPAGWTTIAPYIKTQIQAALA